jgi:hypothetical protein
MELRPIHGDHPKTNLAKFRSYWSIGSKEKIKMLKVLRQMTDYTCQTSTDIKNST